MTNPFSNQPTGRRSFLKTGATAAASLVAAPFLARAASASRTRERILWQPSLKDKSSLQMEVEDNAANGTVDGGVYTSRMVKGEREGHKWRTRLRDIGLPNRDEAALRYEWYIPSNSAADTNDFKMPGLAGLPEHEGGWDTATGGNHKEDSWSFRVHSRSVGTHSEPQRFLQAYLYAQSAGGLRLSDFPYGMSYTAKDPKSGDIISYSLDTWNEMEVRANTSQNRIELWVNGVRGVLLTDVAFTVDGDAFISQIIAETFYNGTPEQSHDIRYRNIRLIA